MTSLIGCHALVFTGEFDPTGIEQSARRARRAGFDLIEYPLMDPFGFDSAAARRAVESEGLSVSASLGLPVEADVSSDDPGVVAAGRELLDAALRRTAEMGGRHLCGVLYGSMRKHMAPRHRKRARAQRGRDRRAGRPGGRARHRAVAGSRQPVREQHHQHWPTGARVHL